MKNQKTNKLFKALQELQTIGGQALTMPSPKRMALEPVKVLKEEMLGDAYRLIQAASEAGLGGHQFFERSGEDPVFASLIEKYQTPTVKSIYMVQRHLASKGPVLTVNPSLSLLLADTAINKGIPSKFLASPFPACFIEFDPAEARPDSGHITYSAGHPCICEGAYIQESYLDNLHMLPRSSRETLELDPNKRTRCIEIGFSASPLMNDIAYKTHYPVAFDNMDLMTIFIQDEDEDVYSLMERHFELYRSKSILANNEEAATAFTEKFKENFAFLMKVLFYISVERKLQKKENSETELSQRLEKVAGKKQDKLKKQLLRVYDKIVIGPESYTPLAQRLESGDFHGKVKPHFRRSYFGIRWKGAGQHKTAELVRVSHAIINEHMLKGGGVDHSREYEIK